MLLAAQAALRGSQHSTAIELPAFLLPFPAGESTCFLRRNYIFVLVVGEPQSGPENYTCAWAQETFKNLSNTNFSRIRISWAKRWVGRLPLKPPSLPLESYF